MKSWAGHFGLVLIGLAWGSAIGQESTPAPVESGQYGAKRLDFQVNAHQAFLILPAQEPPKEGRPWVWYAPTFIGKLPDPSHEWMARQWLDAGFAIGGVDVGESCGNTGGRTAYSQFRDHVVSAYGLSPKACLLPQSRGGLMLLNWAVEHPDQVQCIAGIYTVCNLESYPGLERAAEAYAMTPQSLKAQLSSHNPLERLKPLAEAKVPVLFIHGDSDKVVPLETNAGELVKRYRALGGPAELIVVPGKGHEVCPEFFHSQAFTDFLLREGRN